MPEAKNDSPEPWLADPLIAKSAALLDRLGYRYVLIGGQAVIRHGHVRFTRDADFTVHALPDRVEAVVEAFAEINVTPKYEDWREFVPVAMVLAMHEKVTRFGIDISFYPSDYVNGCMDRAVHEEFEGRRVPVLGREDLIIHKVVAHRPQDETDAVELLARYPDLDTGHIRHWLGEFQQATEQPLLDIFEKWRRESL